MVLSSQDYACCQPAESKVSVIVTIGELADSMQGKLLDGINSTAVQVKHLAVVTLQAQPIMSAESV